MNSEQLQKWARLAEVVGAVAVVVTLVFLIVETSENTNAIQSQTYQALTAELNRSRSQFAEPEEAEMFIKLISGDIDDFSEVEYFRIVNLYGAIWGTYESAYYALQRGVLGQKEWERFEQALCRNLPATAPVWEIARFGVAGGSMKDSLTEEFADYVELQCDWPAIRDQINFVSN